MIASQMLAPVQSMSPVATEPAPVARSQPAFAVTLVGPDELTQHESAWQELADNALEPNCFYEPWMLLPALRHLEQREQIEIALIHRHEAARSPLLCGLVPLERRRRWRGLPVRLLTAWKHQHCLLGAPLLLREHAREALQCLLQWAASDRAAATLLELPFFPGEGPLAQALIDVVNRLGLPSYGTESFTRALLRPAVSADEYLQRALSPKHRREFGRMRRRLGDHGKLETRRLAPGEDVQPWLQQFLRLEASGWKGNVQTALNCDAGERAYFSAVVQEAHRRGKLMMLGLFLDGEPVALKCNFLAGRGVFTFKIAFDERFDKYSPGVQLELDNIGAAHDAPGVDWMDSCAIADHPMINRLWSERRIIQSLLIAPGGWRGNLLIGLLPLLRALKRTWASRTKRNVDCRPRE